MSVQLIQSFIHEFNQHFGDPFLPKGFAEARMGPDGDSCLLRIGARTMELRFNFGKVEIVGSSFDVGDACEIMEVLCTREEHRYERKLQ